MLIGLQSSAYKSASLIGKHLRKNGDLKTVADIQKEDKRKEATLVYNLANELESKDKKCEEIKREISKTEMLAGNVMKQTEEMTQSYNAEMEKLRQDARNMLRNVMEEHDRSRIQLEARREELESWDKELKQRQALNDNIK